MESAETNVPPDDSFSHEIFLSSLPQSYGSQLISALQQRQPLDLCHVPQVSFNTDSRLIALRSKKDEWLGREWNPFGSRIIRSQTMFQS